MTNRELLEKMIHEMTDEELADMIYHNDFKNMALFDNSLRSATDRDRIVELLESKAEE